MKNVVTMAVAKIQVRHFNLYGLRFIGALGRGGIDLGGNMRFLNRNKPDTENTKKREKILKTRLACRSTFEGRP